MMFYILNETNGTDLALWWKPERCGYTTDLNKAGKFEEAEARSIERNRGTDHAIACDIVEAMAMAVRVVSIEKIWREVKK